MDKTATWLKTKAKRATHWLKTQAKKVNLAEWGMLFFTFIIALNTFYGRRQWKATGEQLYEMGEASREGRMAQWAYVDVPQEIKIRPTVEHGKVTSWIPEITMVNDGNSGTYNTLEIVNVFPSDKQLPDDFGYSDTGKRQNSDLGPHETKLFDAQPIGIDSIHTLQNGGHVYIYGLAEYWDVFQFHSSQEAKKKYQKHLREFCYELRLDSSTGDVTSIKYSPPKALVLYGPDHNCIDGVCPDYSVREKLPPPVQESLVSRATAHLLHLLRLAIP